MEMTVLMNTIKYSIKDCENGRNGQNAGNIWTWTGPQPHPPDSTS